MQTNEPWYGKVYFLSPRRYLVQIDDGSFIQLNATNTKRYLRAMGVSGQRDTETTSPLYRLMNAVRDIDYYGEIDGYPPGVFKLGGKTILNGRVKGGGGSYKLPPEIQECISLAGWRLDKDGRGEAVAEIIIARGLEDEINQISEAIALHDFLEFPGSDWNNLRAHHKHWLRYVKRSPHKQ